MLSSNSSKLPSTPSNKSSLKPLKTPRPLKTSPRSWKPTRSCLQMRKKKRASNTITVSNQMKRKNRNLHMSANRLTIEWVHLSSDKRRQEEDQKLLISFLTRSMLLSCQSQDTALNVITTNSISMIWPEATRRYKKKLLQLMRSSRRVSMESLKVSLNSQNKTENCLKVWLLKRYKASSNNCKRIKPRLKPSLPSLMIIKLPTSGPSSIHPLTKDFLSWKH